MYARAPFHSLSLLVLPNLETGGLLSFFSSLFRTILHNITDARISFVKHEIRYIFGYAVKQVLDLRFLPSFIISLVKVSIERGALYLNLDFAIVVTCDVII